MKPLFPVSSPVTGVSYGKRQAVIAELSNGDPLFFKRERGNPYDPEAVAVLDIQGRHVGYLPNKPQSAHEFKHMIFECMDEGVFNAVAAEKRGGYPGYNYGLSVKFYFIPKEYFMRGAEAKDEEEVSMDKKRNNTQQKQKPYEGSKYKGKEAQRRLDARNIEKDNGARQKRENRHRRQEFKRGNDIKSSQLGWHYSMYISEDEAREIIMERRAG